MNKLVKKLSLLAVIAMFGTSLVGCGKGVDVKTSTLNKDKLVIGYDDTFVPMGFKDDSGETVGFDVDLAKAVSKKLKKEIEFQSINWTMKESELNSGNIDLIWNGYSIDDDRKEKVEFSNPYLNNTQIIVTMADSPINSKKDLEGKSVGAQADSTAVTAVEKDGDTMSKIKDGSLVTFKDNNDVLMDLESGRVDAVVVDEILARYYMRARGEEKYKVLDDNFGEEQYGVGIRKGDTEFVDAFNKALAEVIEDGTAAQISEKWFDKDIVIK